MTVAWYSLFFAENAVKHWYHPTNYLMLILFYLLCVFIVHF